jgi:hypothetical protein
MGEVRVFESPNPRKNSIRPPDPEGRNTFPPTPFWGKIAEDCLKMEDCIWLKRNLIKN